MNKSNKPHLTDDMSKIYSTKNICFQTFRAKSLLMVTGTLGYKKLGIMSGNSKSLMICSDLKDFKYEILFAITSPCVFDVFFHTTLTSMNFDVFHHAYCN